MEQAIMVKISLKDTQYLRKLIMNGKKKAEENLAMWESQKIMPDKDFIRIWKSTLDSNKRLILALDRAEFELSERDD
jgi:hypothetical protein